MKTGYLRKTQFYIIIICFIVLGNGLLMHYSYQGILQDVQDQKLSHAYQHQLRSLEDSIVERSTLYKQYINHKSKITLTDLQLTEQKIKIILSRLVSASTGMVWDEPLKKLMEINQQFTSEATELARAPNIPISIGKGKNPLALEAQMEERQKFAAQIDQLDLILKNYIIQLRQIADQAEQLSAQEIQKQRQFCVFLNLMTCLIIVGLLVLIYFWIGYRLRRSIITLTHALQDYSLFGARIPVFKGDQASEMGHLTAAAQSFRENVIENIIVHLRDSHPGLFKEVGHIITASQDLKLTVNEILDVYDDSELKTKDLILSNEQTRNTLRTIIKQGENFLGVAKELEVFSKNKKAASHLKNLESLIEQAHQAIVKEQNAAKRIATMAKIESKQKKIFELLLELSVKMAYVSEQLEKELSSFIQVSPIPGDDVIINRR